MLTIDLMEHQRCFSLVLQAVVLLITLRLALQLQRMVVQGVPLDNTSRVVILVDSFSANMTRGVHDQLGEQSTRHSHA